MFFPVAVPQKKSFVLMNTDKYGRERERERERERQLVITGCFLSLDKHSAFRHYVHVYHLHKFCAREPTSQQGMRKEATPAHSSLSSSGRGRVLNAALAMFRYSCSASRVAWDM